MKIILTEFAERHFSKSFGGTKIMDISPKDFETHINDIDINILNGYAPFCKLAVIPNFTATKVGSLPITLENYQYIRTGYSSRNESELPVFSRWFEFPYPISAPKANYLVLVLYDKNQLEKENGNVSIDADYGIVAILGQSHPNEEPMKPETMLRNALGIEEGGSGTPLNRVLYMKSVEFWDENATVK